MTARIAVLASGRGSNLQAILNAIDDGQLDAQIVGVFSDKPDATALQRVPAPLRWASRPRDHASRVAYEQTLGDAIAATSPDWIVCAGYMRILGANIVERFNGKMINIHPSLLPKYKGLHTHQQALDAGDSEHGASVHLVTAQLDAGTVLSQSHVPVLPSDDANTLAERVLTVEHPLLVGTLSLLCSQRLRLQGELRFLDSHLLFNPLRLDSQGRLQF